MSPPVYRTGDCYAFRITHPYDTFPSNFFENLMSYAEGLLVVEHKEEGKRTHIHAALLNAKVSHKRIKQVIQTAYSAESPVIVEEIKGAGNFSLKKWDTQVRYLVYMLKGKYTFLFNKRIYNDKIVTWVDAEEEERLRLCWKSESIIENEYSGFKVSKYWPSATLPTVSKAPVLDDAFWAADHGIPRTEELALTDQQRFAEIRKACINYILGKYGGFITPKNRYLIKDLISNFCLFNDIKMLPLYI